MQKLILILFTICSSIQLGLTQDFPSASFQDDGQIILEESSPIQDEYIADVNHYSTNARSQQEGQQFLEQFFNKEFISLEFNYEKMEVKITLDRSGERSSWDLARWNEYLSK